MTKLFLFFIATSSVALEPRNPQQEADIALMLNFLREEQGLPITLETVPRRSRFPTAIEFQLMCVPGTFFRHHRDFQVTIYSSDGHFAFSHVTIATVNETLLSENLLLSLPTFVSDYLVNLLAQGGVGENLQNCTVDVLNTLPDINVQFHSGRIVLFGSDIFTHEPDTNSCSARYAISDDERIIVPQLFPDISVSFVENGEMFICEDVGDEI